MSRSKTAKDRDSTRCYKNNMALTFVTSVICWIVVVRATLDTIDDGLKVVSKRTIE